jgi:hypothetical protein
MRLPRITMSTIDGDVVVEGSRSRRPGRQDLVALHEEVGERMVDVDRVVTGGLEDVVQDDAAALSGEVQWSAAGEVAVLERDRGL